MIERSLVTEKDGLACSQNDLGVALGNTIQLWAEQTIILLERMYSLYGR